MTTHIEIGKVGAMSSINNVQVETVLLASATLTPSASNQITEFDVTGQAVFATLTAGEDIYLAIGPEPDATADPRRALGAGMRASFAIGIGEQVAVVSR